MSEVKQHPRPILLTGEQADFLSQTFAALSDATRLRIIYALTQGEQTVGDLTKLVHASQSAVSHHLFRLRALRLVQARREGNRVFYGVDDQHVSEIFREAFCHLDHVQGSMPGSMPGDSPRNLSEQSLEIPTLPPEK